MTLESDPWVENPPRNIIIRMPNWLGDVVMTSSVIKDLRKQWPEATITAMCQSNVAPLLKHDPHLDEIYAFHARSGWLRRLSNRDIIERLREGGYDLGILFTHSFSSAWKFWRGRVKWRIGYAGNVRDFMLTKAVWFPKRQDKRLPFHASRRLLKEAGVAVSSDARPKLYLEGEEVENAHRRFRALGITDHHVVIGVAPGAAFGTAKQWLPFRFHGVIEQLLDDPLVRVVVFGDTAGEALAYQVCEGFSDRVVNLAGKTSLREFMAMSKLCDVFLANDSGPMHVAAAVGTPVVTVFGPTPPQDLVLGGKSKAIYKKVECSPCYKRVCPIDHRCMTRIEVSHVVKIVRKMIQETVQFPANPAK